MWISRKRLNEERESRQKTIMELQDQNKNLILKNMELEEQLENIYKTSSSVVN